MASRVGLVYIIESVLVDNVFEVLLTLRSARDNVNLKYEGRVRCIVLKDIDNYFGYVSMLKELQVGSLEGALREFLSAAGLPVYVNNGSDFRVADRVLVEYKKTLRRRFAGSAIGKVVEDLH